MTVVPIQILALPSPRCAAGLFATNRAVVMLAYRQQYMVSPDGKSFILNSEVTVGSASPIFVIVNWKAPK